jgi:hypothetical protein
MNTLVASLAIVVVAMCSTPARLAAADDPKRAVLGGGEVIVGRVMFVDPRAGTVVVEFPSGPQRLSPDQRDLDRFVFYQGKDLVFDSRLRPQWDAPLPSARESARPR